MWKKISLLLFLKNYFNILAPFKKTSVASVVLFCFITALCIFISFEDFCETQAKLFYYKCALTTKKLHNVRRLHFCFITCIDQNCTNISKVAYKYHISAGTIRSEL